MMLTGFPKIIQLLSEEEWTIDSTGNFKGTEERISLVLGYRNIWSQGIFGSDIVTIGNSIIDGYDSTDGFDIEDPPEPSAEEPNADVGSKEYINMDNPNT